MQRVGIGDRSGIDKADISFQQLVRGQILLREVRCSLNGEGKFCSVPQNDKFHFGRVRAGDQILGLLEQQLLAGEGEVLPLFCGKFFNGAAVDGQQHVSGGQRAALHSGGDSQFAFHRADGRWQQVTADFGRVAVGPVRIAEVDMRVAELEGHGAEGRFIAVLIAAIQHGGDGFGQAVIPRLAGQVQVGVIIFNGVPQPEKPQQTEGRVIISGGVLRLMGKVGRADLIEIDRCGRTVKAGQLFGQKSQRGSQFFAQIGGVLGP